MAEIIARVANAIERAEVGYHLRLTSLVDGVSMYTLSYDDGTPDLKFECMDDAYAHIADKKRQTAAWLAIEAMREPSVEMVAAGMMAGSGPDFADPDETWRSMIDAALNSQD